VNTFNGGVLMLLKFKPAIQVAFLAAFLVLITGGRVHIWMFVFLGSVFAAVLFGRFYCGWICPINTITDGINWFYDKLKIKRKAVPERLKSPIVRYGLLILFIAVMVLTLKSGKKLPVLPVLAVMGVLLTLVFVPALWHRYLCPYGTFMNITGRYAKHYWKVDKDSCIKCGMCKKTCPAEAVIMESREVPAEIDRGLCLECTACTKSCPKDAIKYS